MTNRVVITGGTGFIGRGIVEALVAKGDRPVVLTRDTERARKTLGDRCEYVTATLETPGAWCESLANSKAVLHLAGEPIGDHRWTALQKQKIRDSRVESTRVIVEAIAKLAAEVRPKALVQASGGDYYPPALDIDFDDDDVTERDPPGDSFLARVCRDWEKEGREAESLGLRVCAMRTGLVLGKGGGALEKLETPFKFFVGGRMGHGRQWVSWIHRDDAIAAYVAAVDDARYTGPINLVTGSVRNADLAACLGKVMHRPSWLPVPKFALKLVVGEMSTALLTGRKIMPAKLKELGFTFQHPKLADALQA